MGLLGSDVEVVALRQNEAVVPFSLLDLVLVSYRSVLPQQGHTMFPI